MKHSRYEVAVESKKGLKLESIFQVYNFYTVYNDPMNRLLSKSARDACD